MSKPGEVLKAQFPSIDVLCLVLPNPVIAKYCNKHVARKVIQGYPRCYHWRTFLKDLLKASLSGTVAPTQCHHLTVPRCSAEFLQFMASSVAFLWRFPAVCGGLSQLFAAIFSSMCVSFGEPTCQNISISPVN